MGFEDVKPLNQSMRAETKAPTPTKWMAYSPPTDLEISQEPSYVVRHFPRLPQSFHTGRLGLQRSHLHAEDC